MLENQAIPILYDDYAQSANTLFHFVTQIEYLEKILKKRAIIPRYCLENIKYLSLIADGHMFSEIAVLQKCFCDIPLHKLQDTFRLNIVEESDPLTDAERFEIEQRNTHTDFYGKFAIALSKKWGENHRLQPVQYINENAALAEGLSKAFSEVWASDGPPDSYADDILNRLSFIKPLRGPMKRQYKRVNRKPITITMQKNFHDEQEWRYVPDSDILSQVKMERIIANPSIIGLESAVNSINTGLEDDRFRSLWLDYSYDDIRYLIVPDSQARLDMINIILNLPDDRFGDIEKVQQAQHLLMSKILVLEEIGKDW